MTGKIFLSLFMLLSAALVAVSVSSQSDKSYEPLGVISGRVVRVADGDTITIINDQKQQTKIRLYGIDAPEKAQDFGNKSREKLASLVAGRNIDVMVMDIDRYGRNVGKRQ